MRNLILYLDDNTKVFECIVSNHKGIIKLHNKNTKMLSLKKMIENVIEGKYFIEFEDSRIIDTSKESSIFRRIELFKEYESFRIDFDTITPEKVIEYVFDNKLPIKKDFNYLDKIIKFFEFEKTDTTEIDGIGEVLYDKEQFYIKYKTIQPIYKNYFTIAHELGHIFLHFSTDKYKHFIEEDINNTEYKTLKAARANNTNLDYEKKILEKEADNFAMRLLVPRFQLEYVINYIIMETGTKPMQKQLANIFGVSSTTIGNSLLEYNLTSQVILIK